ncbi:MAG: hypothetical protein E7447_01880 [Ruminococcaceae bacterium]|nr:hypothetical protein [Oscillospiraceae bacterium]
MKIGRWLRVLNFIGVALMLVILILQFLPFWNCSDCKSHKEEDKMVSIAEYLWLPDRHKPITEDMTELFKSIYGENIVDDKGKPFKFDVSQISPQLIVAFICGILAPVAGILFSKKTLPMLIPFIGSVATLMIFLMSPVMQAGQNWIVSVIVAGVCAAVSGVGIVIGFISWVKVRGRYFGIPRKVPVAQFK